MATTNGTVNNGASNGHDTPATNKKSNMQIEYRTERSIPMFLLHKLIRPFATQLITATKEYPPGSPKLESPQEGKEEVRCQGIQAGGHISLRAFAEEGTAT